MAETATHSSVYRSVRSRTFAALEHPDFRRYYFGQAISLAGTWLQGAAVRWLVFEQTHSEFMLGVVEVASLMPGLLVGLFAGALADRVAPLKMIVLMECAQMVLAFVLALVVWLEVFQVWQLALILALARICVTFELPSRQVLFFDLVGPEKLPNAIALNSGLFNATRVVGPALAGVGLSMLGAAGCFAVNGVSYVAAIAAVLSIRLAPRPRPLGREAFTLRELLGGLGYLRHNRRILAQFTLVAFFGFVGMGYEAMVPAYADGRRHRSVRLQRDAGVQRDRRNRGGVHCRLARGPGAQGTADDRGNGHVRRIPRRRGSPAGSLSTCVDRNGATGGGVDLPPGRGLWGRALLFVVIDADPISGPRSSPRPDHGDLDDRLLRVGPVGSALDGTSGTVVGRLVCDGVVGVFVRGCRAHCLGVGRACTDAASPEIKCRFYYGPTA